MDKLICLWFIKNVDFKKCKECRGKDGTLVTLEDQFTIYDFVMTRWLSEETVERNIKQDFVMTLEDIGTCLLITCKSKPVTKPCWRGWPKGDPPSNASRIRSLKLNQTSKFLWGGLSEENQGHLDELGKCHSFRKPKSKSILQLVFGSGKPIPEQFFIVEVLWLLVIIAILCIESNKIVFFILLSWYW